MQTDLCVWHVNNNIADIVFGENPGSNPLPPYQTIPGGHFVDPGGKMPSQGPFLGISAEAAGVERTRWAVLAFLHQFRATTHALKAVFPDQLH